MFCHVRTKVLEVNEATVIVVLSKVENFLRNHGRIKVLFVQNLSVTIITSPVIEDGESM